MCTAISYNHGAFMEELIEKYELDKKSMKHADSKETEYKFQFQDKKPLLPIITDTIHICEWGNRDNKISSLPHTGWCRAESLTAGKWDWLSPTMVRIPASHGLEKGVWFPIKNGIQGVLVYDKDHSEHIYMLTQSSDEAYRTLTQHDRMPAFV